MVGEENVRPSTGLLRDVVRQRDFHAGGSMALLGLRITHDRNDLSRWNVDAHEPWQDADGPRPAFVFSVDTGANSQDTGANSQMGGGL